MRAGGGGTVRAGGGVCARCRRVPSCGCVGPQLDGPMYKPNFRAEVLAKNPPLEALRVTVGPNKTRVLVSPRARVTEMPVHPALEGKMPWAFGVTADAGTLAAAAEVRVAAAATACATRRAALRGYVDPVAREDARMATLRASRAAAAAGEVDPGVPPVVVPPPEIVRFTPLASRRFMKRSHNGKYVRVGACAHACACAWVCVYLCVCVGVCLHACVCLRVYVVCACVRGCVCVRCVHSLFVCVCLLCVCGDGGGVTPLCPARAVLRCRARREG